MRKIFIDEKAIDKLVLTGDDHLHLSVVLRAKIAEEVIVCNGDGYDYTYKILSIDKKQTVLKYVSKVENNCEPTIAVTLFSGLTKGDKLEIICQKCTELGVSEIVPFQSEFSQVKSEAVRVDRLSKICLEGAKQCGRGRVPVVKKPISFADLLSAIKEYDWVVFPYEGECAEDLKNSIKGLNANKIAIIVGGEGGFSLRERDALIDCGVTPVSLGKRILRAETACIAVAAVVMCEMGEWK